MSSRSRLGGGGEYSVREEQKQLINNLLGNSFIELMMLIQKEQAESSSQ